MLKTDWECLKCHDKDLFEFQEKLQGLYEKEGLFLKCENCGNPMKLVVSGVCGSCGNEK